MSRFYAIGFILYFPSDDPYWIWLPSHEHMLLITVIFIGINLLTCIFLFLQSSIVWYVLQCKYSHHVLQYHEQYSMIDISDNVNDSQNETEQ